MPALAHQIVGHAGQVDAIGFMAALRTRQLIERDDGGGHHVSRHQGLQLFLPCALAARGRANEGDEVRFVGVVARRHHRGLAYAWHAQQRAFDLDR